MKKEIQENLKSLCQGGLIHVLQEMILETKLTYEVPKFKGNAEQLVHDVAHRQGAFESLDRLSDYIKSNV